MVGMLYHAQNNTAEARKWYEGALAQNENAPTAANNLAYSYAEEGVNLDIAMRPLFLRQAEDTSTILNKTIHSVGGIRRLPALALGPLPGESQQTTRQS